MGGEHFCHLLVTLPRRFQKKRGLAQSWHAADRVLACLLWTACLVTPGCGGYADFTLPSLPGGRDLRPLVELRPDPVLTRGSGHDVLNPSVVFRNGVYFNFYSAFDGHTWRTALATSPDGDRWTPQGAVLTPDPKTWERAYIAANGSALFDAGQWWYWYQSGDHDVPRIGLAQSADGRHWTKVPSPVIEPGPRGSWDERGVADPYVLKLAGVFYVYYLGQNRARQQQIGLARSADGVHWTKLRSSPVLTVPWPGSSPADENGLGEPAVWQAEGWYWMIYTGRDTHERRSLLTARSTDGVHWTTLDTFRGAADWDRAVVCDPSVLAGKGTTRLWFGGGDQARPDENLNGQIGQYGDPAMKIGITCYPTYGGSGIVATELGLELAARGHDVHFITYANPIRLDPGTPRIFYHEVEVATYPLFQYPPYTLALASRMAEVAEGYSLDLLHVHYAIPHSISALLAKQMLAPVRRLPVHHHVARNRYHAGRHGSLLLPHHQVLDRAVRRRHLYQRRFASTDGGSVRGQEPDPRDQQLRQLEIYHPDEEKTRAREYAPDGEKLLIHLSNFRPVKRVLDCIRILAAVTQNHAGASLDGGRRTGARARRAPGSYSRRFQTRHLPR